MSDEPCIECGRPIASHCQSCRECYPFDTAAAPLDEYRQVLAELLDTQHGAYGLRHQPCQCDSHKPARALLASLSERTDR